MALVGALLGIGATAAAGWGLDKVLGGPLASMQQGDWNWELNLDDPDPEKRVIKKNSKTNEIQYSRLGTQEANAFGGWAKISADARARSEKIQRGEYLNQLKQLGADNTKLKQAELAMQHQQFTLRNLTEQSRIAAEAEATRRSTESNERIEGAKLDYAKGRDATLAEEARAKRFDERLIANNQVIASMHDVAQKNAEREDIYNLTKYKLDTEGDPARVFGRLATRAGALILGATD